jgi:hypothetical protein
VGPAVLPAVRSLAAAVGALPVAGAAFQVGAAAAIRAAGVAIPLPARAVAIPVGDAAIPRRARAAGIPAAAAAIPRRTRAVGIPVAAAAMPLLTTVEAIPVDAGTTAATAIPAADTMVADAVTATAISTRDGAITTVDAIGPVRIMVSAWEFRSAGATTSVSVAATMTDSAIGSRLLATSILTTGLATDIKKSARGWWTAVTALLSLRFGTPPATRVPEIICGLSSSVAPGDALALRDLSRRQGLHRRWCARLTPLLCGVRQP